ncbi:MAG TPA: 5-oxoprolinase subunit PxpB [Vicinamibacterales bacterium]|nr:5-oxoprolinase subunit PxpB [Vicinamibacterales bacterium]
MTIAEARVVPAGDAAWLVELPDRLDAGINGRAVDLAARIRSASWPGVRDVVVGFRTVMVYVDPLGAGVDAVPQRLDEILAQPASGRGREGSSIEVPVCYDGACGPDLPDIAAFAGCAPEEVVRRHLAREYRVFVVGFMPGFAYMASVDPRIAAPRRSSPRLKVPPGSVAIAAGQTGIYPSESPGGWHIIGRTPAKPYDPDRAEAFLFAPGDRVRFVRISAREFDASSRWGAK